ncbi:MAG: RimK/LysX family protein [Candidatus Nanoarchaeia archaeon]|nr:RimK/LysX family protein [Candidatus Nanoarchaeia archaeon]
MEKTIVGIIEDVTLIGKNKRQTFKAKIDTGATRSSMDLKIATDLKLELTETVTIKSAEGSSTRGIVMAKVIISGRELEAEFTIANRSKMSCPVLIGRNILKENFLVDPSRE